jgi:hypothetical protein
VRAGAASIAVAVVVVVAVAAQQLVDLTTVEPNAAALGQ